MVQKKTNKTNLEKKSILFFEYGLVVALAIALAAFETGKQEIELDNNYLADNSAFIPEDMMQITRPEPPKLLPPPVPVILISITDDKPEDINTDIFKNEVDPTDKIEFTIWEPKAEEPADLGIFHRVEKMPTYRGGTEAEFQKHLQQLVRYPQEAQELNIEGKVILKFVVDEKGNVVMPEILLSSHELLSNAVLDALGRTGKWKPGEQLSLKVKVTFTIPIFFRLQ